METTIVPPITENRIRMDHAGHCRHGADSLSCLLQVAPTVAADIALHAQSISDEYDAAIAHDMFIAWMDADMAAQRR